MITTDAGPLYSDGYRVVPLRFLDDGAKHGRDNGKLSGQPIQVVDNVANDVSVWKNGGDGVEYRVDGLSERWDN